MALEQETDISLSDTDDPLDIKIADLFAGSNPTDFENMDSLISHSNWYERECIDHYDDNRPSYFSAMLNLSSTGTPPSTPVSKTLQSTHSVPQLTTPTIIPPSHVQTEGVGSNQNYTDTMTMKYTPYELTSPYVPRKSPASYNQGTIHLANGDRGVANEHRAPLAYQKSPAGLSPPRSVSSNDSDCELQDTLDILITSFRNSDSSPLDVLLSFLGSRHGIELVAKANDIPFLDLYNFMDRYQTESGNEHKQTTYYHDVGNDAARNTETKSDHSSASILHSNESSFSRARKSRGSYSRSKCIEVVQFVRKGGHSARAAAKKFGIPKSTVHNWLHEDIGSRPERGHRKRVKPDFSPCTSPRNHEFDRNEKETGYQPRDTPRDAAFKISTATKLNETKLSQPSSTNSLPVKRENPCNIAMDASFDELKEDWVQQENWYAEQYLQHYSGGSPLETPQISMISLDAAPQFTANCSTVPTNAILDTANPYYPITSNDNIETLPFAVERQLALELQHLKLCDPQPNPEVIFNKINEFATPYFTPSPKWCQEFLSRHGLAVQSGGVVIS